MANAAEGKVLPFTILDGMVLVAGCAVSAWMLSEVRSDWLHLHGLLDWMMLTAFLQYGITVVGPILLGLQFMRGRRRRLLPGETAWSIIALELMPVVWLLATDGGPFGEFWDWYLSTWLVYCSPVLVWFCTLASLLAHFRTVAPRPWSHSVGLGVCLAQCIPSTLLIVSWFVGLPYACRTH